MKALVLRNDTDKAAMTAQALMKKGFQVLCVETRKVADALIRIDTVDLLIMEERSGGVLTHALALSAERRNPYVSTILMTDRPGAETDELYDLIPCLYGLVGTDSSPALLSQLAMSSIENFEEAEARVKRNAAADAAEEMADAGTVENAEYDEPIIEDADLEAAGIDTAAPPALVVDNDLATEPDFADDMPDVPSYADAVLATPALADPSPIDEELEARVTAATDDALGMGDEEEGVTDRPAAHMVQVSVVGGASAVRA